MEKSILKKLDEILSNQELIMKALKIEKPEPKDQDWNKAPIITGKNPPSKNSY